MFVETLSPLRSYHIPISIPPQHFGTFLSRWCFSDNSLRIDFAPEIRYLADEISEFGQKDV